MRGTRCRGAIALCMRQGDMGRECGRHKRRTLGLLRPRASRAPRGACLRLGPSGHLRSRPPRAPPPQPPPRGDFLRPWEGKGHPAGRGGARASFGPAAPGRLSARGATKERAPRLRGEQSWLKSALQGWTSHTSSTAVAVEQPRPRRPPRGRDFRRTTRPNERARAQRRRPEQQRACVRACVQACAPFARRRESAASGAGGWWVGRAGAWCGPELRSRGPM